MRRPHLELTVLRRWFTFFFIPLFPVGGANVEAIQCTTCHTRFDRDALRQPTASVLTTQLQGAVPLATAAVARAAGVHRAGLRSTRCAAEDWCPTTMRRWPTTWPTLDVSPLDDHLASPAGTLCRQGREEFLDSLARVARAGTVAKAQPVLERSGADSACPLRTSPVCSPLLRPPHRRRAHPALRHRRPRRRSADRLGAAFSGCADRRRGARRR